MMKQLLKPQVSFSGLLGAVTLVAALSTLFGFLGRYWWVFDLFSHFRVQYFIGLTGLAAIFFILRKWRYALFLTGLAGLNMALILPLYFPPAKQHHEMGTRIMLMNVWSDNTHYQPVANAIVEHDPDVLLLEELTGGWLIGLHDALSAYPYGVYQTRPDSFGIGLFSKLPLENEKIAYIGRSGLPSVVSDIVLPSGTISFIGTHPKPPWGATYTADRNEQLAALPAWVRTAKHPVVMLGDLNVTPWCTYFRQLVNETGLRDSARGYGVQVSWPAPLAVFSIPIDHCLHDQQVTILDRKTGGHVGSDHFPLIVELKLP